LYALADLYAWIKECVLESQRAGINGAVILAL